jgi:hypothetical protein
MLVCVSAHRRHKTKRGLVHKTKRGLARRRHKTKRFGLSPETRSHPHTPRGKHLGRCPDAACALCAPLHLHVERDIPLQPSVTIASPLRNVDRHKRNPAERVHAPMSHGPPVHLHPASRARASAHRSGLPVCVNTRAHRRQTTSVGAAAPHA